MIIVIGILTIKSPDRISFKLLNFEFSIFVSNTISANVPHTPEEPNEVNGML